MHAVADFFLFAISHETIILLAFFAQPKVLQRFHSAY